MLGDFPPSSKIAGVRVSAAAFWMSFAVWDEPVIVTFSTSGCRTMASPTSPSPETMFTVPGGSTSLRSWPRRNDATLACSGGLATTVLPAAKAPATLLLSIATGML